jgi:hypothetical protein
VRGSKCEFGGRGAKATSPGGPDRLYAGQPVQLRTKNVALRLRRVGGIRPPLLPQHDPNVASDRGAHPGGHGWTPTWPTALRIRPWSRHNRKRPAGEAGRFWGYYREERTASRQAACEIPLADAESSPVVSG